MLHPKHILSFPPEIRKKIMYDRLVAEVGAKGGEIISGDYQTKTSLFTLRCSQSHIWDVRACGISLGSWCPKCANVGQPRLVDGLAQADAIAKSRRGTLLSTEYITTHTKMIWACSESHEWSAALCDIKKGTWCPKCSQFGVREEICRIIFESITKKEFIKTRPIWLVNSAGKRLELDGFSEELGIAFEHQGEQHYREIEFFNKGRSDNFDIRQKNDDSKRKLCASSNVSLIEIKYDIPPDNLPDYIYDRLAEVNPSCLLDKTILTSGLPFIPTARLRKITKISESRGGNCISRIFLGETVNHKFICGQGHEWAATPTNVKSGSWCPVCAKDKMGKRKYNTEDMKKIALDRGGYFLGEFKSVNYKYQWICGEGHAWQATPSDIIRGRWCKKCSMRAAGKNKIKYTPDDIINYAKSRGGSVEKITSTLTTHKQEWICGKGHTWLSRIGNTLINEQWCQQCKES